MQQLITWHSSYHMHRAQLHIQDRRGLKLAGRHAHLSSNSRRHLRAVHGTPIVTAEA